MSGAKKKMKTQNTLIVIAGVLFVAISFLGLSVASIQKDLRAKSLNAEIPKTKPITLLINTGEGDSRKYEIDKNQTTAFDALKEICEKNNIGISGSQYEAGVFIKSISGKENGQDNKYWIFYVNGEMSQSAADKKMVNAGDIVEFKFQSSPF